MKDEIMATVERCGEKNPRNGTIRPDDSINFCWWNFAEITIRAVKENLAGLTIKTPEGNDCRNKTELKNKGNEGILP